MARTPHTISVSPDAWLEWKGRALSCDINVSQWIELMLRKAIPMQLDKEWRKTMIIAPDAPQVIAPGPTAPSTPAPPQKPMPRQNVAPLQPPQPKLTPEQEEQRRREWWERRNAEYPQVPMHYVSKDEPGSVVIDGRAFYRGDRGQCPPNAGHWIDNAGFGWLGVVDPKDKHSILVWPAHHSTNAQETTP
jgi:hypothetical protein